MTGVLQRLVRLALGVLGLLSWQMTAAHEMTIAEMELREVARGELLWQWTASGNRPAAQELRPVWPEHCREDDGRVHCDEAGFAGTLTVEGIGQRYSAAIVKVYWIDGERTVVTLTARQPSARLYGSAEDRRGAGEIAATYLFLGVEHILSGFDHLLFVFGLLFLVGFNRRLVATITAFTVAHSLTLALSALDLIALRPAPVEAVIALSIMLVAGEALHRETTLARRWPALVAFLFGLVHGLGFAGALREIGLPDNHITLALVAFNGGVELGQLMVVSIAYLGYRTLARVPAAVGARAPALYAIGSIAAYWSWSRVVALFV